MEQLINKKVILWDFDGVILDSSTIRENGFIQVLSDYPIDKVNQLLEFHRKNGGLSRYVKFEYFYTEILKIKATDLIVNNLSRNFSAIMKKSLINNDLIIKEVDQFITSNNKKYKMHIVSGSDDFELKYLCKKLEISGKFKSIHGSPTPKTTIVKDLMEMENYKRSKVCLIGDSINDYHAAQLNNIDFFGYNNNSLREKGYNYINSFL